MAHRILNGPDDVGEYIRYLDDGWPERQAVIDQICDALARNGSDGLRLLELCSGPGVLASAMLQAIPQAHYIGVDISEASTQFAAARTADISATSKFIIADVNGDEWLEMVDGPFDGVVSMQSLHDLGGEREVQRIYNLVYQMLDSRGTFVNADLLRDANDPPDKNPGRLSEDRHLELLREAGFHSSAMTAQIDRFGCFEAYKM